jgi:hypothetical protein
MNVTFKDFFYKKEEENLHRVYRNTYENFMINEMSLRTDSDQDVLNKPNALVSQGKYYKEYGEFIETVELNGNALYLYRIDNSVCFLTEQKLAIALVEYTEHPIGTINMSFINTFRQFPTLMETIFIEYLLKKYDTIISDCVQTDKGFNFYKKMAFFQEHNNYSLYIKGVDGELKKVNDGNEMNSTFGYDKQCSGYRYILKNN